MEEKNLELVQENERQGGQIEELLNTIEVLTEQSKPSLSPMKSEMSDIRDISMRHTLQKPSAVKSKRIFDNPVKTITHEQFFTVFQEQGKREKERKGLRVEYDYSLFRHVL